MKASPSTIAALWCVLAAAPALAQNAPVPVTVLAFSEQGPADGMGHSVYNSLRTQIEFHRDYRLNDVPPQSLDDLLMAVGCSELDRACSQLVSDIVGTEVLAWGAVIVNEATVTIRMTLWDLSRGREVRSRSHILPRERVAFVEANLQVIGRSLLYGDRGSLVVEVEPAGAVVDVVGFEGGVAPLRFDDIPLGFYTVRVAAEGYLPASDIVVVDVGGAEHRVSLEEAAVAGTAERDRSRGGVGPGAGQWALIGTGAALVVAGTVAGVQKQQTQSEFDDVLARQALDRNRAESLRDRGETQARMSNAFVGVGIGLIAAGVVWKVVSPERRDADDSVAWDGIGAVVGRHRGGATVRIRF